MLSRIILITALSAPAAASAEGLKIVTDIAPIHSLAAGIMAGIGEPELLVPGSGDPHSFQLRPSQARAVSDADLVVWVGPALTPWLDRALDGLGDEAHMLTLLTQPGTVLRDGNSHDHGEDEHEEKGEEGHDEHGGTDPHAWLSPDNARTWVAAIAAELSARDPQNAPLYSTNATTVIARIDEAQAKAAQLLADAGEGAIVTYHDAYGYFTDAFGIHVAGAISETDAAPPSAAHMAEMRELVEAGQVACVFADAGHDAGLVANLVEGSSVGSGTLDPSGVTLEPGPGLYPALIEALAGEIADCLSGR